MNSLRRPSQKRRDGASSYLVADPLLPAFVWRSEAFAEDLVETKAAEEKASKITFTGLASLALVLMAWRQSR